MVAHAYPPNRTTASSRTHGLSHGLVQLGHSVTLLSERISENDLRYDSTNKPVFKDGLNTVLVFPHQQSMINKLYCKFLDLISPSKRPRKLYNTLSSLDFNNSKFDIIWATFPDHCSLAIAEKLSRKLNIPWVVDFRDCYQNKMSLLQRLLLPVRMNSLKNVISSAHAITSVAKALSAQLNRIKPNIPVYIIENAFDKNRLPKTLIYSPIKKTISFVFTGTIIKNVGQTLIPLLDSLKRNERLIDLNVKVEVFGRVTQQVINQHKKHKLANLINFHGIVSRETALMNSAKADILVMGHIMSSKLYDYISVQRPILMTRSDFGECERHIHDNNIGWAPRNNDEMDAAIKEIFYMAKKGNIPSIKPSIAKKFEYSKRAKKLDKILTKVVKKFIYQY